MHRKSLTSILAFLALSMSAQQNAGKKAVMPSTNRATVNAAGAHAMEADAADSTTFKGTLYNKEYNVYIRMDFYHKQIRIPGQDVFGDVPGFFGDYEDGRKWLFTDATLVDSRTAKLQIVNDYGSEDLESTLTLEKDGTYLLTQGSGSTLKIARNRKWVKMPKKLVFTRQ